MDADSLTTLSAGQTIGDRFEIVGVLGEGGTGVVYDARMRCDDGESVAVALKVIHDHLAGDRQVRARFEREARILSRLRGDHLCPVLDAGELPADRAGAHGRLFLALARIDGEALDARLRVRGSLSVEESVRIALGVCDALHDAHTQGVIHRDLKPANVLLAPSGAIFVVDFGMAKIVTGAGVDATALTQRNMIFGTPEYMAPEQARGDVLDARCDVYAVGVLLYEMLSGAPPFRGPTALAVLTAHLTREPSPVGALTSGDRCPVALEAVVHTALAKRPEDRYVTAEDLARALREALARPEDARVAAPTPAVPQAVQVDELALARTLPSIDPPPRALPDLAPREAPSSRSALPARRPVDTIRRHESAGAPLLWVLAVVIGIALGIAAALRFS